MLDGDLSLDGLHGPLSSGDIRVDGLGVYSGYLFRFAGSAESGL
jgi:hypothetical protein